MNNSLLKSKHFRYTPYKTVNNANARWTMQAYSFTKRCRLTSQNGWDSEKSDNFQLGLVVALI